MGKLHEVLAVEADKEGIARKIVGETDQVFRSRHNLFLGSEKTLKMADDAPTNAAIEAAAAETQVMETTVAKRLEYTEDALVDWFDAVFQKEVTNQTDAKGDLVVDGITLAESVPATFLLGLESKLKNLRTTFLNIPTLQPGIRWTADAKLGNGIYSAEKPEIRSKTQKQPAYRVLYDATDKHPAQIEKWAEDVVVGTFEETKTSSMLPAAEKAELLGRLDRLIQATKQARMRANSVQASDRKIAKELFKFIHNGS